MVVANVIALLVGDVERGNTFAMPVSRQPPRLNSHKPRNRHHRQLTKRCPPTTVRGVRGSAQRTAKTSIRERGEY